MSGTMRRRVLLGTVVVLALQALLGVAVEAKMVGDMRVAVVTGANRGIGKTSEHRTRGARGAE